MSETTQEYKRSEIRAGIVIIASVVLLIFATVVVGNIGNIFAKTQKLTVTFMDIQGLKVGDPVLVMGVTSGNVTQIDTTQIPDTVTGKPVPRVKIQAKFRYEADLTEDTNIAIEKSLTGNTFLKIEPGTGAAIAEGKVMVGTDAMPVTDLANKVGQIAKRIDTFLNDITGRDISDSIRAVMFNFRDLSGSLKAVAASLGKSIPESERSLVSAIKNVDEVTSSIKEVVTKNKSGISETFTNVRDVSRNISSASDKVNVILTQGEPHIKSSLANVDKSTSNLKTLTREVRWQPWVLLNKPDSVEIKERSLYNSALEMSEGAETLYAAVKELKANADGAKQSPPSREELLKAMKTISDNLEKLRKAQDKLWTELEKK